MKLTIAFTFLTASFLTVLASENNFNHKQARDTAAAQNCYWSGTAPFCHGSCAAGFRVEKKDRHGTGHQCWTGRKAYCCN
ncbi:hypothetical protein GALMADRAFT_79377 [Galerina marginata CBS 339.88]|uniref:Invertebrate defensins family profile domain-containing protein n=1 Tax=Galerina marginata (strain CBS 339.88) TaxID=685588 RepID=A0A067SD10_GALM3|nr:hypothetical protein GALMADRAFT_79377 [Galerina marginata CBS 339.88]